MINIKVTIDWRDYLKFAKRTAHWLSGLHNARSEGVKRIGIQATVDATMSVPIDSGELANSIGYDVLSQGQLLKIYADAPYANEVETGAGLPRTETVDFGVSNSFTRWLLDPNKDIKPYRKAVVGTPITQSFAFNPLGQFVNITVRHYTPFLHEGWKHTSGLAKYYLEKAQMDRMKKLEIGTIVGGV
jgi:hypothetical protein